MAKLQIMADMAPGLFFMTEVIKNDSPLHTAVHPHEAALHQIGQEWKSDKRFVFKKRHEKCRKE